MIAQRCERGAFALLCLLALTCSFELVRYNVPLGGIILTNVEVVLYSTLLLWAIGCALQWRWPAMPISLILPVLLWLLVFLAAAWWAPAYRTEALHFWVRLLSGVLIGWAAYDLAKTQARLIRLGTALATAGLLVGWIGLAEATQQPTILTWLAAFKYAATRVGDLPRISATLGYATIAASILALTLPLMLAWLLTTSKPWLWFCLLISAFGAEATLVLTLTRAALVALAVAFGWLLFRIWIQPTLPRQRYLLTIVSSAFALLVLLVGVIFWLNPLTRLRLASETEDAWYRATYHVPTTVTVQTGAVFTITVAVANTSVRTWQASGARPFALSYHLLKPTDSAAKLVVDSFDGLRTALPNDLAPNNQVQLQAQVQAPDRPGTYVLAWDMVQEEITWFSWKKTPQALTQLVVTGPRVVHAESAAKRTNFRVPFAPLGRLTLWRAAILLALDHPLLGVGPDNFRRQFGAYVGLARWDTNIHANNLYLEELADGGVLGLAVFLWLVWQLLRIARTTEQKTDQSTSVWLWQLAFTASLLTWFVHGLFDYFYEFTPTYVAFWLVAGLALRASSKPVSQ